MSKDQKSNSSTGPVKSMLDDLDTSNKNLQHIGVEYLNVHTEGTVHAKRMPGTFRTLKWWAASVWLFFFVGPYIQWDNRQAIWFDLEGRQFHIFGITVLPQDVWVLAMILLFYALLLAATTAIAGRMWCGYGCFQTVWMDVFTWIEEKVEGLPNKRVKIDKEPISFKKFRIKLPKWIAWGLIGFLTGFTFVAYFDPAIDLWARLFTFDWTSTESTIILSLAAATVFFAGFLREQTCIGFCPYARIQGAMIDTESVVPTYDYDRGEPRGRLKRAVEGDATSELGDCIDCNLCVAVCPTGVDIRKGQQFGCITCGLCIDACDSIMEKIKKPKGLIRYASLAEFAGKTFVPFYKRPRVITYTSIMAFALAAIIYGISTMSPIDVKVLHERAPLFVAMSDGSIQNKYVVKIVNKSDKQLDAEIKVRGPEGLVFIVDEVIHVEPGNVGTATLLVRIPKKILTKQNTTVKIDVQDIHNPAVKETYSSMFIGPRIR